MSQRPMAVGLFLCEQVIVEEHTRNVTVVNSFTKRVVNRSAPGTFPFLAFAILVDGVGTMTLEILVQRLDDLDPIWRREIPATFANPLQEMRCRVGITDCWFPVIGSYQVVLLAEGEPLASRKLHLIERNAPS